MSRVALGSAGSLVERVVGDIKHGPRVRRELSSSRIDMFVELYRSAAEVPPIEIYTGTDEIRAGNHRRAALDKLEWNSKKMMFKEVAKPRDYAAQVVDAFADNVGGSQPPSYADSVYVIKGLLEKKVKSNHILKVYAERVGETYPEKMVKDMIRSAKSQITQNKVNAALTDVREHDATVKDAAAKHGLDEKVLKKKIGGKKKGDLDLEAVKKTLSGLAIGHSRKIRAELDQVFHQFEAGTASAASVLELIGHVEQLNQRADKAMIDARIRFEKLGGPKYKGSANRTRRARKWKSRRNSRRQHVHDAAKVVKLDAARRKKKSA